MTAPDTGPRGPWSDFKNGGLKVADVMRTDFRSCNASTPAAEAAAALRAGQCPVLAVTRAQEPTGVVTEHCLTIALAEHGGNLSRLMVRDVMSESPLTIPMKSPAEDALARFSDTGGPLLAVDADGLLKGVVTMKELAPQLTEAALARLVARLAERGSDMPGSLASGETAVAPVSALASAQAHPEPLPLVSPSDLVNPMLTVADVMTASARTCAPQSTVVEAALIFGAANCGAVPVTENGKPVGILTDRDVALAAADRDGDLAGTVVGDLMSRDVAAIASDAPLADAVHAFGDRGVRRLMVVDHDGTLSGILSWTDLIGHVSDRGLGHVVAAIEARRS
jgi:predicted transcriptional regulator